MTEYLLGVAEGDFTLDYDAIAARAKERWRDAVFVPSSGQDSEFSYGQLQLGGAAAPESLRVDANFLPLGAGIQIEGSDVDRAAELIALVTDLPDFPDDNSVVLMNWSVDFLHLRPSMTPDEILAAYRG